MLRTILICFVLAGIAMPLPLSAQHRREPRNRPKILSGRLAEVRCARNQLRDSHRLGRNCVECEYWPAYTSWPKSGFMLEGDFVLLVEGQAPLPVKAGESTRCLWRRP